MGPREAARAPQAAPEKALITAVSLERKERGSERQAGEMEWRLCFISCGNSFVSLMGSKSRSGPPSPRSPCRRREAQKARGGGSLGWLGRSWLRGARGSRGGASLPYSTVPLSLGLPASLPSCSTLFLLAVEGKTSGPSASAVWALGRGNFSRFPSEQLNSQARKGKRVSTLSWRKWVCSIFSYFASISCTVI